jgi:hypothetical protein
MEMAHGKKPKTERAAWVPESILDDDVSHFMGAAAAAKKAGKSHFDFGGKKYKVTMKHDTAKKVDESAECPTCGDGECQCEQPVEENYTDKQDASYREPPVKSLKKLKQRRAAEKGKKRPDPLRNTKPLKFESVEEAAAPGSTAQHGTDTATSDTFQKQMGGGRSPREKEFVDMHKTEVGLDVEKVTAQNKQSMEDALKQTPPRMGDQKTGDTSFVNPVKAEIIDGITKALQQMKTNS